LVELCEVVITAPDHEWLMDLSRQLVAGGLCASVHGFAPVRSVYRWRGEVHERTEGRVWLHTRLSRVDEIVARVKASRPYEVPGVSARSIVGGSREYLQHFMTPDYCLTPEYPLAF
jgi:periplasmic divalent cation tolerance protein